MPPPSLAREFFDSIVQAPDPVAVIRGLVNANPPPTETDWLDFKAEHPDPRQREKKVRETWSEALGGFANNQGGVLVWGLDARKTKVGGVEIDAVCGERPVEAPQAFRSRLVELQRGATDPPLANVDVVAYEPTDTPGKGFVVCYVPEGPFKPYRSEQAGRQWYIRAGDNTVVMSRSVLQAMFYPRSKAVFRALASLSWELPHRGATEGRYIARLTCSLDLVNEGTATARDVVVLVTPPVKDIFASLHSMPYAAWHLRRWHDETEFQALRPMHRHRLTPLFEVSWEVEARARMPDHLVVPHCPSPSFRLAIFCENQKEQVIEIGFDITKLVLQRTLSVEASPEEEA
jgi:hypothetical protein